MNSETQNTLISLIDDYPIIRSYFGRDFLVNSIKEYVQPQNGIWSTSNPYLVHLFRAHHSNRLFFDELEKMLDYLISSHFRYMNTSVTKGKLRSTYSDNFQGEWSKLIFTSHLAKNKIKIINVGPRVNAANNKFEPIEREDILTDLGSFEIKCIFSERWFEIYDNTDSPIFLSSEMNPNILNFERRRINKIINQNHANYMAIDCTYHEEIYDKMVTENFFGIMSNFHEINVSSKGNLVYFIRNLATEQVDLCKIV